MLSNNFMDNLQETIKRNLFFKVDFDGKYTKKKGGKIEQAVRFFLIGVLPIVIEYADGKKERAIINTPLEVKPDPYLRMLHGARFKFIQKIQKEIKTKFKVAMDYKGVADDIVAKATGAINQIGESKKFQGKEIKSIMIINIGE